MDQKFQIACQNIPNTFKNVKQAESGRMLSVLNWADE